MELILFIYIFLLLIPNFIISKKCRVCDFSCKDLKGTSRCQNSLWKKCLCKQRMRLHGKKWTINSKLNKATECKCGKAKIFTSSRIIGEDIAMPHYIPYQVGLVSTSFITHPFCGGSLISRYYVLTAAHCFFAKRPKDFKISLGEHDISISGDGEFFIGVESFLEHPKHSLEKFLYYDIGLVKMKEQFQPSAFADIICLPQNSNDLFESSNFITSGWGTSDSSTWITLPNLRAIRLKGVSNKVCGEFHPNTTIGPEHICATHETDRPCFGDSGGPLATAVNGLATLVGVTSFGMSECGKGPSGYARVSHVLDWIYYNTDAKEYQCTTS